MLTSLSKIVLSSSNNLLTIDSARFSGLDKLDSIDSIGSVSCDSAARTFLMIICSKPVSCLFDGLAFSKASHAASFCAVILIRAMDEWIILVNLCWMYLNYLKLTETSILSNNMTLIIQQIH